MRRKLIQITLALNMLLVTAAWGGQPGENACEFLNIAAGARGAALGGAFTAADDVISLYWNPAGIAALDRLNVSFSHINWMGQALSGSMFFVYPSRKWAAGTMVNYLGVKEITGLDEYGFETGRSYSPADLSIAGSWAVMLGDRLASGVSIKYIRSVLTPDAEGTAVAMDLGFRASFVRGKLKAGAAIKNLGTSIKLGEEHPLPMNITFGAGYNAGGVMVLFDAGLMPFKAMAGAEYSRNLAGTDVSARIGYISGLKEQGRLAGITAGFGIGWRDYLIDYAWLPKGDMGVSSIVSISAQFGGVKRKYLAESPSQSTPPEDTIGFAEGLVLDENGKPLHTATVKIVKDGIEVDRIFTDENGRYMSKQLERGVYELKAWKKGYESRILPISLNADIHGKADFVLQEKR